MASSHCVEYKQTSPLTPHCHSPRCLLLVITSCGNEEECIGVKNVW